jgi:hypothetical protein
LAGRVDHSPAAAATGGRAGRTERIVIGAFRAQTAGSYPARKCTDNAAADAGEQGDSALRQSPFGQQLANSFDQRLGKDGGISSVA